ncbi:uncharacterized protein BJ171DRAFT_510933 [Polychytrium aggregatum]|uniref:uncharacterized protein n=1 Tax=Polychytrium aggregatum TaxID=110093 RepID=UPI0022FDDA7E|nr:uncharacterized protein BJ171DRAFT_510933 [Polychytrium aggregatum]KAI9203123.1 hypothetical protein BJ171DRAFT_510933 [Polychytrium aggregatum]
MSVLPPDLIQSIAEAGGIHLKEDVAKDLARDVEYRVREILHESKKFMRHARRDKLLPDDINMALKVRNIEPLYGYSSGPLPHFKQMTNITQPTFYLEDPELDLDEIVRSPLPKVPLDVTYTAHWLAIDGVQPATLQNPTPAEIKSIASQQPPSKKLKESSTRTPAATPKSVDEPKLEIVKAVLSKELQLYYDKIIEYLAGTNEDLKKNAIMSISKDPGIQALVPYFIEYIKETITKNLRNLPLLWSMMRFTNAILKNPNIFIEPYLHPILPCILTCLVSKRLSASPAEDHWTLRNFSATLVAFIIKKFGSIYPTLQSRTTKTLLKTLLDPLKSLPTYYGCLIGMEALGPEVVKVLLVPNVKTFGELVSQQALASSNAPTNPDIQDKEKDKCHSAVAGIVARHLRREFPDQSKLAGVPPHLHNAAMEEEFGVFGAAIAAAYQSTVPEVPQETNDMDMS